MNALYRFLVVALFIATLGVVDSVNWTQPVLAQSLDSSCPDGVCQASIAGTYEVAAPVPQQVSCNEETHYYMQDWPEWDEEGSSLYVSADYLHLPAPETGIDVSEINQGEVVVVFSAYNQLDELFTPEVYEHLMRIDGLRLVVVGEHWMSLSNSYWGPEPGMSLLERMNVGLAWSEGAYSEMDYFIGNDPDGYKGWPYNYNANHLSDPRVPWVAASAVTATVPYSIVSQTAEGQVLAAQVSLQNGVQIVAIGDSNVLSEYSLKDIPWQEQSRLASQLICGYEVEVPAQPEVDLAIDFQFVREDPEVSYVGEELTTLVTLTNKSAVTVEVFANLIFHNVMQSGGDQGEGYEYTLKPMSSIAETYSFTPTAEGTFSVTAEIHQVGNGVDASPADNVVERELIVVEPTTIPIDPVISFTYQPPVLAGVTQTFSITADSLSEDATLVVKFFCMEDVDPEEVLETVVSPGINVTTITFSPDKVCTYEVLATLYRIPSNEILAQAKFEFDALDPLGPGPQPIERIFLPTVHAD